MTSVEFSWRCPQVAYLPIPGGHIKLSERFVDPAFSFAMGWNYWYVYPPSFGPGIWPHPRYNWYEFDRFVWFVLINSPYRNVGRSSCMLTFFMRLHFLTCHFVLCRPGMVQFGPANSWLFIASPLPAELSAASVLINFWVGPDKISNAVWITICLIVTVTINLLGAGVLVNRCSKDNSD